jgi:hypothetical protein
MPNLYEYIGIRPSAATEDIPKAIEATERRWRQTGEINKSGREVLLRQAAEILTDPKLRAEYNKKYRLPAPGTIQQEIKREAIRQKSHHLKRTTVLIAGVIVAVSLVAVFWMTRPGGGMQSIPSGTYLLDLKTGKPSAVLIAKVPDHTFPNGTRGIGCNVLILATGEKIWIEDSMLLWKYKPGGAAPKNPVGYTPPKKTVSGAVPQIPVGSDTPKDLGASATPLNPVGSAAPMNPADASAPRTLQPGEPAPPSK